MSAWPTISIFFGEIGFFKQGIALQNAKLNN